LSTPQACHLFGFQNLITIFREALMKSTTRKRPLSLFPAAVLMTIAVSLGGCVSNAPTASEDVGEIILKPGDSKTCISTPCTVWFQMPEGTGTYTLLQDGETKLGDYPAGQKVRLGNFWSRHYFKIPNSDFPEAHLYTVGTE
jgi:hypothetical protein